MKCCFCSKKCENQWGNNPWPLKTKENDRCCNVCNEQYVITARLIGATDIEEVKKYINKKRDK